MKEKIIGKRGQTSNTVLHQDTMPSNILLSPSQSLETTLSHSSITIGNSTSDTRSTISSPSFSTSYSSNDIGCDSFIQLNASVAASSLQPCNGHDLVLLDTNGTSYVELQPSQLTENDLLSSFNHKSSDESNQNATTSQPNSIDASKRCCFFFSFLSVYDLSYSAHPSDSVSTPINAVRNVITKVLSEQNISSSTPKPPQKRSRGSRLENKFGLNITEDELVSFRLSQMKKKRDARRKSRQELNPTNFSSKVKRKRRRKTEDSPIDNAHKVHLTSDRHTILAFQQLDDVIQMAQPNFDPSSDEENIFAAINE